MWVVCDILSPTTRNVDKAHFSYLPDFIDPKVNNKNCTKPLIQFWHLPCECYRPVGLEYHIRNDRTYSNPTSL